MAARGVDAARPGRDDHVLADRWSSLHHGIDPDQVPFLSRWLRLMWAGGRVLDRAGVPPTGVTVAGAAFAAAAVRLADERPVAAGAAVVCAALSDGLDGATAVVGDRATRSGALADAVADRVCDAAFALVLRRRGASPGATATAVALAWGVDTVRRVRRVPTKVTVAERPTFAICAAVTCAAAPFSRGRWPARVSVGVWIAAGVVGIGQLLRTPGSRSGRMERR